MELFVVVTTWQLTFRLVLTSPFPLRMSQPNNDMRVTFVRMVQKQTITPCGQNADYLNVKASGIRNFQWTLAGKKWTGCCP